MKTNNNKHITTNETMWIRQLLSSYVTFLSSSKVAVAFNMQSSNANTNLPIRSF